MVDPEARTGRTELGESNAVLMMHKEHQRRRKQIQHVVVRGNEMWKFYPTDLYYVRIFARQSTPSAGRGVGMVCIYGHILGYSSRTAETRMYTIRTSWYLIRRTTLPFCLRTNHTIIDVLLLYCTRPGEAFREKSGATIVVADSMQIIQHTRGKAIALSHEVEARAT